MYGPTETRGSLVVFGRIEMLGRDCSRDVPAVFDGLAGTVAVPELEGEIEVA